MSVGIRRGPRRARPLARASRRRDPRAHRAERRGQVDHPACADGARPAPARRREARRADRCADEARRRSPAPGMALVPEGRRLFGELTVEENLQLGLAARRRNGVAGDPLGDAYELFPILEEFRARPAGSALGRAAATARDRARTRRGAARSAPRRALARAGADRRRPRLLDARHDPRPRARDPPGRAARPAHGRARRPDARARERRAPPDPDSADAADTDRMVAAYLS